MKKKSETINKASDNQIMINIKSGLQINDFISYKNLAEVCGLKYYTGGKSKQLQLDNLKRFIEYEYDADQKKYLITDIKDRPDKKPPRKLREDAIYTKYIEILLLSYLNNNKDISCVMSKKRWWLILSMVNADYVEYEQKNKRVGILDFNLSPLMDIENINAFYFRTNKRFTTLFYRALDNLEKRRLINYSRVYLVRYEDEEELHVAEDFEESEIIDGEHEALEELGLKTLYQLYQRPELIDDYNSTVKRIQKERYGIEEAYREIKIVHGKQFIEKELECDKTELLKIANECNTAFKNNIDNELNTSYKNYRNKLPNYNMDKKEDVDDMNLILETLGVDLNEVLIGGVEVKNYIENQKLLSNKLISKGAKLYE